MNATGGLRLIVVAATLLCGLTASGCGHMARQAVKDGLFSFVSGSLNSGVISAQFADFVTSFLTSTGGALFR